jgi:hypothetical protein
LRARSSAGVGMLPGTEARPYDFSYHTKDAAATPPRRTVTLQEPSGAADPTPPGKVDGRRQAVPTSAAHGGAAGASLYLESGQKLKALIPKVSLAMLTAGPRSPTNRSRLLSPARVG